MKKIPIISLVLATLTLIVCVFVYYNDNLVSGHINRIELLENLPSNPSGFKSSMSLQNIMIPANVYPSKDDKTINLLIPLFTCRDLSFTAGIDYISVGTFRKCNIERSTPNQVIIVPLKKGNLGKIVIGTEDHYNYIFNVIGL